MYASSPTSVCAVMFLLLGVSVLTAAETPTATTADTPTEATADTPPETTADVPAETPADAPAETMADAPQASTANTLPLTDAEGAVQDVQDTLETPDEVYAVAITHYSNSRWRQAGEEFSRFAQLYPDHPQAASALFFRAEAAVQQGQYAQARKDFLDFVAREPDHRYVPQARFRAAEALYLTGDSAMAREELERFAAEHPDASLNAHAKTYLAELALSAQDGARAAALFKEVLERHPDGAQVDQCRFGLGRALELQGDIESARIAYQTLAAAGGPLADDAQVQLGICLYNHGKYPEAEAAFQAASDRFPSSELLAQARYWLGMSQVARHDWDNAALSLQAALEQYPQHALAPAMTFWRAEACRHRGELALALEGYARVLQDWPDCPWADDSLHAQVQLALADAHYDRVVSLAEQFAAQFPQSPLQAGVEQSLGRAYLKLKQYGQAIEILKRVVASASEAKPVAATGDGDTAAARPPEEAFALQANWYYLALAYLGDAKYEAALEILTQVNVPPENQELYGGVQLARAMALAALNRRAEAIEPLQRYLATGATGENADACRLQLTEALLLDNRLDDALQVHAKITGQAAQDPRYAEATQRLIGALIQSNRLDEALQAHAKIAGQAAREPRYAEATQRLAETALAAGKYDEAIGLFNVLTQDGQPSELAAKGWAGLAWANSRAGKAEAAALAFGQLVERYPDSPLAAEAAMMKAKSLEESGRSEEALGAYLLVATKYDKSEHLVPAIHAAVRLQEKLGRQAESVPLLRRLIKENPKEESLEGVLYQLACLLSDQGQADEADRLFLRITAEFPDSEYWADATYRLAQRAATARQYDRARQIASQLTPANCTPQTLERVLFLRGQLAAATERWQDVVEPLRDLLQQFPDSSLANAANFWIAEAFYQQKNYEEAGVWSAKVKLEQLADEPAWAATTVLRQAQILAEQQRWQEAYDLANGIEKRFPQFTHRYEVDFLLGRCLTQQHKFAAALQRFERVIRSPEGGRTETAARAQWMIGEIFAGQSDLDQALRAYYRVESLYRYPEWKAAALVQAGKCHELKGENADAATVWSQVVAKYSDTQYSQEAAERLKQLNARMPPPAAAKALPPSRATAPISQAKPREAGAAAPARSGTDAPARSGAAAAASFTAPVPAGPMPAGPEPAGPELQNTSRNARRRTLSQP